MFTTAFRKIREGALSFNGMADFTWDGRDDSGVPAASGLYYLRVEVRAGGSNFQKVEKLLILR